MGFDQWLVFQVAKLIRHRYGEVLGPELPRWQAINEQNRLQALVNQLAGCGEDITLRYGVQLIAPEKIRFGNHVAIGSYSILRGNGGITLEDFVLLGDHCILATAGHPIGGVYFHQTWTQPITLKSNVWLGAQVIVMPGVTIGENAVIGAGAVVTEDIPANSVAVGVPARVTRFLTSDSDELLKQKAEIRAGRLKKIATRGKRDVFGIKDNE